MPRQTETTEGMEKCKNCDGTRNVRDPDTGDGHKCPYCNSRGMVKKGAGYKMKTEATTAAGGPFTGPPFRDIDMDRTEVVEKLRSLFPNVSETELETMLFGKSGVHLKG